MVANTAEKPALRSTSAAMLAARESSHSQPSCSASSFSSTSQVPSPWAVIAAALTRVRSAPRSPASSLSVSISASLVSGRL